MLIKWLLVACILFIPPTLIWLVPVLLVSPGVEWGFLFNIVRIGVDLEKAESDEKHGKSKNPQT